MQLSYEDWFDKYGDDHLSGSIEAIQELYLPSSIIKHLVDYVEENSSEILESQYEDYISSSEEQAYEEYKERDII